MSLYSEPPVARTFRDDKPTLLVSWWCSCCAATIIILRVCGRYIRTEKLFKEDWIAFSCLIPLFIRMGLVHVVLLYGTNNAISEGFSAEEVLHREIGSRLVLGSRVFYAATLWMLKLTITEFFKRLTIQIWRRSYEVMLQSIRWFLLVTFIGVVIADISECQPITHYWQVIPDPGPKCRQGFAQLLTMGIANVTTDLLLVVFPIPIILRSKMSVKRKVQLVSLFGGSIIPAIITLYRIPNIVERQGSQQYRSLWASIEILLATAVANALVLGSFVRDRGVKKAKWKFGSMSDSMDRTISRRGTAVQHWGSDEDLVRDLGLGVEPELRGAAKTIVPRPAPMVPLESMPGQKLSIDENWRFPSLTNGDGESQESDATKYAETAQSPGETKPKAPKRRVSFFDVGGLIEDGDDNPHSGESIDEDAASIAVTQASDSSNISPTTTRKGSAAFLQDVGGLLSSSSSASNVYRSARYPRGQLGTELKTIPQERLPPSSQHTSSGQLQDIGGLLK